MSGEARQTLKGLEMKELGIDEDQHWGKNRVTFERGDEACDSASDESSMEDPQSSVSSPSSCRLDNKESSSNGPLYELSQLINELPIKRGLSKNYIGKSQSFTSLTKVKSIEELGKRGNSYYSYKMRMKARKSYELAVCCPKAGIEKASSKKKYVVSSLSWNDFKSHLSNHHGRASDV